MELVCRLLEVSRSGYYEWLGRKPSLRRQKDQELKRRLLSLHQRYPALGLDSLYHLIRPQLSCSRKRIHRLMNEMNISSTRRRAYKATTNSRHAHPIAPNLLARRFSFDKPDTAWVGDITYIPTGEGWLYCAVVKDLCTKQIVGYAFSDRIDTNLTLAALGMAVRRRKPLPGLIFHSDRGVQYAAYAYRQRLASLGIRQSMSRKGDPYDNAVAENFFSCLKCECVHLRHFASRAHAMADVFAYIETFTTQCARIPLLAGVLRMPLRVPCLSIPPPECDTTRYPAFLSVFSSFLLSTKPGRAQSFSVGIVARRVDGIAQQITNGDMVVLPSLIDVSQRILLIQKRTDLLFAQKALSRRTASSLLITSS